MLIQLSYSCGAGDGCALPRNDAKRKAFGVPDGMLDHKAGPTCPPDPLAATAAMSVMAVQQSQPSMLSARHTIPSIAQRNLGLAWVEMVQKRRGASAAATAKNINKNNRLTGPNDQHNTAILRAKKQHETHTKFRSSLGPAKMQKITLAKSFKAKGLSKVVVCSLTDGGLITGTSGDDTFIGARGEIDNAVIQAGAGTDTLRLTVDNASDNNAQINSTDLEVVIVRAVDATALDLADATGLEQLFTDRSGGLLTANNVATDVTVGVRNTTNGMTANFDGVDGDDDEVNLILSEAGVNGRVKVSQRAAQNVATLGLG